MYFFKWHQCLFFFDLQLYYLAAVLFLVRQNKRYILKYWFFPLTHKNKSTLRSSKLGPDGRCYSKLKQWTLSRMFMPGPRCHLSTRLRCGFRKTQICHRKLKTVSLRDYINHFSSWCFHLSCEILIFIKNIPFGK